MEPDLENGSTNKAYLVSWQVMNSGVDTVSVGGSIKNVEKTFLKSVTKRGLVITWGNAHVLSDQIRDLPFQILQVSEDDWGIQLLNCKEKIKQNKKQVNNWF